MRLLNGLLVVEVICRIGGRSAAYNSWEREREKERGARKTDEGELSVFTPPTSPAGRENTMISMNTQIFVKRGPKCKNAGTVWSLAERRGNVGEPRSIREGVYPGGGIAGKKVDISSNNVAQQQHTSSEYQTQ